jgi:predicted dehydrogenase
VSQNPTCEFTCYASIDQALARFVPDRVIVANETARHAQALEALCAAGFSGPVLVEKPVFSHGTEQPALPGLTIYVAYNLRFHPLVLQLHSVLAGFELYSAVFQAGQFLPQWRPATDYRNSYSAQAARGGGVLRDLSHEIDLALWLCGPMRRVAACGGHFSQLEIDSEDCFAMLAVHDRCQSVSIQVNYLDRMPRRQISINAPGITCSVDLISGIFARNAEITQLTVDRDASYLAQLEAFLADDCTFLCTLQDGLAVLAFIERAEQAASSFTWA